MKQTATSWAHSAVIDIPIGMAAFTANTTHIASAPLYFLKDLGNMSHFMRDWRSLQDSNAAWHQLWDSKVGKYLPGDYESMAYTNGRQVAGYINSALLMAKTLNVNSKYCSTSPCELTTFTKSKAIQETLTEGFRAESQSHSIQRGMLLSDLKGYTSHGLNRAIGRDGGRGVQVRAILDALTKPKKVVVKSMTEKKFVGKHATVILNQDNKIVTVFGKSRGPQVWDNSGVVQP